MNMKRRNFLRLMSAAVVAPAALLTAKPDPWAILAVMREKNAELDRTIIAKARQQGMTNSVRETIYFRGMPLVYQENLSL